MLGLLFLMGIIQVSRKTSSRLIFLLFLCSGIALVFFNERARNLAHEGASRTADRLFPQDQAIPYDKSLRKKLADIGWKRGGEIFIRIFKQEDVLELYGKHEGKWQLLKSYDICRWSGKLGPKFFEGDKQAPEGFYMVSKKQMNPHSRHHLSFNLGFPNQVEKAQGKTGSFLMVHGGCSSIGCYAITDAAVEEVYQIVDEAFAGGQKSVAVHAFPFHMNEENLRKNQSNAAMDFWQTLKPGYDAFEIHKSVPKVYACNDQYGYLSKTNKAPRGCKPLRGWL